MHLRKRGVHLSYCTNIHPGETWAEVRHNLERYLPRVKAAVSPDADFGVGLRLSAEAARALEQAGELQRLLEFFGAEGLYVFTLNGFPYGVFHATPVKEAVYLPDWLDEERLRYTDGLAHVLSRLLPADTHGTISTVPGAFRSRVPGDAEEIRMAELLIRHAATLHRIAETTGRRIELALEPEPCCFLETTADVVRFFELRLHSDAAVRALSRETGLPTARAEDFLRQHLTVCLDACHMAVEFEEPRDVLLRLSNAGVRVGKVQLSAGLEAEFAGSTSEDEATLSALGTFAEGIYLHQVVERAAGRLARYTDLPEAIARARSSPRAGTWRVHFHVPIFEARLERFRSTQAFLRDMLAELSNPPYSAHLEVETYTWGVLPEEHRRRDVVEAIVAELKWALDRVGSG